MVRKIVNIEECKGIDSKIVNMIKNLIRDDDKFECSIYDNSMFYSAIYLNYDGRAYCSKIYPDYVTLKENDPDSFYGYKNVRYDLDNLDEVDKKIRAKYNIEHGDLSNSNKLILNIVEKIGDENISFIWDEYNTTCEIFLNYNENKYCFAKFNNDYTNLTYSYLGTDNIEERIFYDGAKTVNEDPFTAYLVCKNSYKALCNYFYFLNEVDEYKYIKKLFKRLPVYSIQYKGYGDVIDVSFKIRNSKYSLKVNIQTLQMEFYDVLNIKTLHKGTLNEKFSENIFEFFNGNLSIFDKTTNEEIIIKEDAEKDNNIGIPKTVKEKVESSVDEEVNNLDIFETTWDQKLYDIQNGDEEALNLVSAKYDKLSDKEIAKKEVIEMWDLVLTSYESATKLLEDETFDRKNSKRNIYVSTRLKDNIPTDNPDFIEVLEKMKTLDMKDLLSYLARQKRLVYIDKFLKIRLNVHKVERLVFVPGNRLGKSSNDIYLYDYITDHNFSHLKDVNIKEVPFVKYISVNFINLSKKQLELAESYRTVPYTPLICIGCAGSGKTLISVEMYSKISNDLLSDTKKDFTKRDLTFLTFNEECLNFAKNQIREKCNIVNAFSIKDFFFDFLKENGVRLNRKNYVDEKDFFSWWEDRLVLNYITDHNRRSELNDYRKHTSSRYAYTFFRGYFKGRKSEEESNVNNYLTKDEFIKILKSKNEPISKDNKSMNILYSLFIEYNNHLEEDFLYDDNDLAIKVRELILEKPILAKYERIIIDEVQDLTDIQLDAIIKVSKDKLRLYFFGDQNQSINPTLFEVNTIQRILMENESNPDIKPEKLNISYRFGPLLAEYMNGLKHLIDTYIGNTGRIDELSSLDEEDAKWGAKVVDKEVGEKILLNSINVANQMIIVPDDEIKDELINKYGEDIKDKIINIYDSKGLEWSSVILYKMVGYYEKQYLDIFNNLAKYSTLHRMIFNQYYVAVTRAKDNFIIVEDEINNKVNDYLFNPLARVNLDNLNLYTYKEATSVDWVNEGKRMFKLMQYRYAYNAFKKVKEKDLTDEIKKYKEVALLMDIGEYSIEEANSLKNQKFYNEARIIYKELNEQNFVHLMDIYLGDKLSNEDIEKIILEEKLDEEDLEAINKFGYINDKSTQIKDKLLELKLMLGE